jgi:nucleoside-diphosphate-sugar epimerase
MFMIKSAAKYKVKRVVITSSIAAVGFVAAAGDTNKYDENCWTDVVASDYSAYNKSKVLAEEAVWNYQKKCESAGLFCPQIVTICPSWVLGEEIAVGPSTSSSITRKIILNEIPAYPNLYLNWCDIKDVSAAHFRAIERAEAGNKRFIIS